MDAEQRQAQRKDQILDAALELFATRGYLNTSIEVICQNAYVSTKSFYQVLENREDCFLALYQRSASDIMQRVSATLTDDPDDEVAAARGLIVEFVRLIAENPHQAKVAFGMSTSVSPAVDELRRNNRRWAANLVEEYWRMHGVQGRRHPMAVALIGGIFDMVDDCVPDYHIADADTETALVEDLVRFYWAVRRGLD